MIEGYLTLNDNLKNEETTEFEHFSFLGDGVLMIKALVNNLEAKVDYEYCPGLNKANLSVISEQISLYQYQCFWQRIAYYLLDAYDQMK
ncbi:hypothetical protein IQ267_22025 [filamentous cyanobacterium LEGE 07170]|nr:hypothetical protein [filamentous cyanobacterium LEGE 07170]